MTASTLDRERVRELFDLRRAYGSQFGGAYEGDPYPIWHRLREQSPVHPGIVHELTGYDGPAFFHGLPSPERPHFSVFSFAACNEAYRNPEVFASSPEAVDVARGELGPLNSMLSMGGAQHRRYRGLVQPVVRAGQGPVVDPQLGRADRAPAHRWTHRRRASRAQCRLLRGDSGPHDHRELRRAGAAGAGYSGVVAESARGSSRSSPRSSPPVAQAGGRSHQRARIRRAHRRRRDRPSTVGRRDLLLLAAAVGRRLRNDLEADGDHADARCCSAPRCCRPSGTTASCSGPRSRSP